MKKSAPGTFAPSLPRTESLPRRLFQRRFHGGLGGLTAAAGSSSTAPAPVSRGDGEQPRCPVFGEFSHVFFRFFSTFLRQTWHWKFHNKPKIDNVVHSKLEKSAVKGDFMVGFCIDTLPKPEGISVMFLWLNHVPLLLVKFINWSE